MAEPDGGQAFPVAGLSGLPNDAWIDPGPGMSLRDWLAGQAIIGMGELTSWTEMSGTRHLWEPKDVAKRAYRIADAMIAERSKP